MSGSRIAACKAIVANRQAGLVDGQWVDMQTANALVLVWDALSTDEAREKFERISLARLVDFAWKHVRVGPA